MDMRAGPSHMMELSLGAASELARSTHIDLQELSSDELSFSDILGIILQELQEKAGRLEELGEQLERQKRSKVSKSLSFSRSYTVEHEYNYVLCQKNNFTNKLIDVLETKESSGVPKYSLQCSEELASVYAARPNEALEEIKIQTAQLLKTKNESKEIESQIPMYSDFLNDNDESEGHICTEELIESKRLFEEAKDDLNMVLSIVYPDNQEKTRITAALRELTEKYSNSETEEEKYVEIPPSIMKIKGMRHLLQGSIIIPHPQLTNKYRICVEE